MPTNVKRKYWGYILFLLIVVGVLLVLINPGPYMKCDPAADVEKADVSEESSACWLAAAANMLAAAGYGDLTDYDEQGSEIQFRADQIYKDMLTFLDGSKSGWAENAIKEWLCSPFNEWQDHYYKITTAYGLETPPLNEMTSDLDPLYDPKAPMKIANHLRRCDYVSALITWPMINQDGKIQASGGHWLTCWGDEGSNQVLLYNPDSLRVTDSDRDEDGDVQVYEYKQYYELHDIEEQFDLTGIWKSIWFLNYESQDAPDSNLKDPFIRQVVVLSRPSLETSAMHVPLSQGSYRFFLPQRFEAFSLRYALATDADILNLITVVDGVNQLTYEAVDLKENQREYRVAWDFKKDPIRLDRVLTISTELAQPNQTGMTYQDLHLESVESGNTIAAPDIGWTISSVIIPKEQREHFALGGYVIGSFDVYSEKNDVEVTRPFAQYRLIHQYPFSRSPSNHWFKVHGAPGFYITNLRFGHSYGYFKGDDLWRFDKWKVSWEKITYPLRAEPIELELDFGPMPYPTIGEPGKLP